tara:strand:- start:51 stop:797 length:747 start_codon:yes stop_codon:yes gene_type:complete
MKKSQLFLYFVIAFTLINPIDVKSDTQISDFNLDNVLKSGRDLMSLDYGLHHLEDKSNFQNTLFIGVHGSDSQGYEWIYPLITINEPDNLTSFYRYNDNICPDRAYMNISNEITSVLDSNKNIQNVVLMGHSYGAMIVALFSNKWINEIPLTIHTVAGPLTGPISTSFKSSLFGNICEYSPPKKSKDNVNFFQWRTIKELDGAFNSLDYDPQIIHVQGSDVTRLPEVYNGRRLGHNWSLSWVAEEITK